MSPGDSEASVICKDLAYRSRDDGFVLTCDSFELQQGELVALVGLNGSGKTTFLKCLCQDPAVLPRLTYAELDCKSPPLYASAGQLSSLSGDLTVADYYSLAYMLHGRQRLPFWSRSRRLECVLSGLREYEAQEHFAEIAWRQVSELSSGERQRLLLADMLLAQTTVLLLDEPAAHFDLGFENRLLSALRLRSQQTGASTVIVSHNVMILRAHVQRVYVARSVPGAQLVAKVQEESLPERDADVLAWLESGR